MPYCFVLRHGEEDSIVRNTMIWSFEKQKWYLGPKLPKEINNIEDFKVCVTAANSSTAFIFYKPNLWSDLNYSYDFEKKVGKYLTKPPTAAYPYITYYLSCALSQTKDYQRKV